MTEHADRLLTQAQVLERLQIGRTKFYELRQAGKIRTARDSRHVLVAESEVDRFIREQTEAIPA